MNGEYGGLRVESPEKEGVDGVGGGQARLKVKQLRELVGERRRVHLNKI